MYREIETKKTPPFPEEKTAKKYAKIFFGHDEEDDEVSEIGI